MTPDSLASDVTKTLRNFIHVPRLDPNGFIVRHNLWSRCELVTTDYHERCFTPIYVDGIAGACRWNSWKVFEKQLEAGLSIWMGYAFYFGKWVEHTWCMVNGRIVESTAPFVIYYGAELRESELGELKDNCGCHELATGDRMRLWTIVEGRRETVPYVKERYSDTIGRERSFTSGEVVDGLGRQQG